MEKEGENIEQSNRVLTIPNIFTSFRIILAILFAAFFLTVKTWVGYLFALIMFVLFGLTDLFDGKIARHFYTVSNVGKILDPIADKVTQALVLICIIIVHIQANLWLWILLIVLTVKELIQGFSALFVFRRTGYNEGAKIFGKVSTFYLFSLLILLLLFPNLPDAAVIPLVLASIALLVYALVEYLILFHKTVRNAQPAAES